MTNRDSTEFALAALPLNSYPLGDFEDFHRLRCPLMQSLMIAPPPGWTILGPDGDLFRPPIQLIPLEIEQHQVTLGIYTHPSLKLFRGRNPEPAWAKICRQRDRPATRTASKDPHLKIPLLQPDPVDTLANLRNGLRLQGEVIDMLGERQEDDYTQSLYGSLAQQADCLAAVIDEVIRVLLTGREMDFANPSEISEEAAEDRAAFRDAKGE